MKNRKPLAYLAGILAIALVTAALLEVTLRAVGPPRDRFYVWPPGMHVTFDPYPEYLPGVEGTAHVMINSDGLRGDDLSSDSDFRVLVFGASSTECSYLDQPEAWPQRLQTGLQERMPGRRVWVGNAGRSGITSRHHVTHMRFLLPQFEEIDQIIVLGGVNDLTYRLAAGDAYNANFMNEADAERELVQRAFSIRPDRYNRGLPWYERLELSRRSAELMWLIARRSLLPDDHGRIYEERRARRRAATRVRDELPDLEAALDEYGENIRAMIAIAREHACQIIFLKHPSIWRADMPPALDRLLWFGAVGDHRTLEPGEYYSAGALRAGLDRFNDRLTDVCNSERVDWLDLNRHLPADTAAFYDDVHFNEHGAELVGEITAEFLVGSPEPAAEN